MELSLYITASLGAAALNAATVYRIAGAAANVETVGPGLNATAKAAQPDITSIYDPNGFIDNLRISLNGTEIDTWTGQYVPWNVRRSIDTVLGRSQHGVVHRFNDSLQPFFSDWNKRQMLQYKWQTQQTNTFQVIIKLDDPALLYNGRLLTNGQLTLTIDWAHNPDVRVFYRNPSGAATTATVATINFSGVDLRYVTIPKDIPLSQQVTQIFSALPPIPSPVITHRCVTTTITDTM